MRNLLERARPALEASRRRISNSLGCSSSAAPSRLAERFPASRRRPAASRMPQDGLYPGQKLGGAEGLDDVVVGSEVQAQDPVPLAGEPGQEDHGYGARGGVVLEAAQEHAAVPARKAYVEQDEVGLEVDGRGERLARVRERRQGVGLGQREAVLHGLDDVGVVLHEQDPGHPRHYKEFTRRTQSEQTSPSLSGYNLHGDLQEGTRWKRISVQDGASAASR